MNEKKNPLQDRLPVGRSAGVGDFAAERHSAVPARSGFGVCDSRHHRNAGRNRKPPARKERSVAGSRCHWNRIDVRFDICSGKRCEITES